MKITPLKDHVLLKTASAVGREYMQRCNPKDPKHDPSATRRESYAIENLLSIGNVVSCIDQLYFSIDMLSGYRYGKSGQNMSRYDYITFGIENYYFRLTSVFDRCLRLANVIFQLGLPERQCNNESIIKNAYVEGTPVANALIQLDKFSAPFRFHRNSVAHQLTYSEKELDRIGLCYSVAEDDDAFKEQYMYLFKKMTDDYIAKKKTEFKNNLDELENLIGIYFDSLRTAFEARLNTYM